MPYLGSIGYVQNKYIIAISRYKVFKKTKIFFPRYDLTITVMVPEPQRVRLQWDAEAAVERYLRPLVGQVTWDLDSLFYIQGQKAH